MLQNSTKLQYQELNPRGLFGVPAYLYILKNSGLKEGMLHIGVSRRGGWAKAMELNRDKTNVIPGRFECVFELRAQDSGSALELVFTILKHARHGRAKQDYFEIDEYSARHVIERCVEEADKRYQLRFQQDLEYRHFRQFEALTTPSNTQDDKSGEIIREGIFKRALAWFS